MNSNLGSISAINTHAVYALVAGTRCTCDNTEETSASCFGLLQPMGLYCMTLLYVLYFSADFNVLFISQSLYYAHITINSVYLLLFAIVVLIFGIKAV